MMTDKQLHFVRWSVRGHFSKWHILGKRGNTLCGHRTDGQIEYTNQWVNECKTCEELRKK